MRKTGKHLTKKEKTETQDTFLEEFAKNANISLSCKIANITRTTVYEWQEHDSTFSLRFKIAEQEANDVIRAEIHRRGIEGYSKPVVSMGKVVYGPDGQPLTENVYSDALLSLLAKARMPEYRDKQQQQINIANVAGTSIHHEEISLLSNDKLEEYKQWIIEAKKNLE